MNPLKQLIFYEFKTYRNRYPKKKRKTNQKPKYTHIEARNFIRNLNTIKNESESK